MISHFFCHTKVEKVAIILLNRRKGFNASLLLKPQGLFISFPRRKETKQRKFAGCRSRAKIFTFFLNEKNSLRSNSFSFFTKKCKNFFTLFHGGRKQRRIWQISEAKYIHKQQAKQKKTSTSNEQSDVESKKKSRSGLTFLP